MSNIFPEAFLLPDKLERYKLYILTGRSYSMVKVIDDYDTAMRYLAAIYGGSSLEELERLN